MANVSETLAKQELDRMAARINAHAPPNTGALLAVSILRAHLKEGGMSSACVAALTEHGGHASSASPDAISSVLGGLIAIELSSSITAVRRLQEAVNESITERDSVLSRAIQARDEAITCSEDAKRASQASEVSASKVAEVAYTRNLHGERTMHDQTAFTLQIVIVGMLVLWCLTCAGFAGTLHDAIEEYSPHWWIPAVGRAFILGTFGGVIVWLMRLYRAERHNVIVYGQKLAALLTFEAFVSVANRDENAKAAIIAHAMGTIFAPHDTGYGVMSNAESAMPTEALIKAFSKATDVAATKAGNRVSDVVVPSTRG